MGERHLIKDKHVAVATRAIIAIRSDAKPFWKNERSEEQSLLSRACYSESYLFVGARSGVKQRARQDVRNAIR